MNILRKAFEKRDLTSGSIDRNIFFTALPLWIVSGILTLQHFLNLFWIGKLGTVSIAAVTIGGIGVAFLFTPLIGVSNVSFAMIGNLVGKKDIENANRLAKEILVIAFSLSAILALIGYFITPGLLSLLGAETEVSELAQGYLRICLIGGIIAFPSYVIISMVRGTGQIWLPQFIALGQVVINIILDYLLILGIGFPKLGVNGAALAFVISGAVATLIGLLTLIRGKFPVKIDWQRNLSFYLPRSSTIREMIRLAGFNGVEIFLINIVSLAMVGFVAGWGVPAIAAYGIGNRLLVIASFLGMDLALASGIITANNLGAGEIPRVKRNTRRAIGYNMGIMLVFGIVFFFLANQVVGIFDKNPQVISTGVDYLRITILGWPLLAGWTILKWVFVGARDTKTPFFISLVTLAGIQITLTIFLPRLLGINGIWYAILAATVFQGLILGFLFYRGYHIHQA